MLIMSNNIQRNNNSNLGMAIQSKHHIATYEIECSIT